MERTGEIVQRCCLPWETHDKQSVRTLSDIANIKKEKNQHRQHQGKPYKDNTKENRNSEEEKDGPSSMG